MPQRIFNAQIDVYAKDKIELRMRCITRDNAMIADNMDTVIIALEAFAADLGIVVTKTADLQAEYAAMATALAECQAELNALKGVA